MVIGYSDWCIIILSGLASFIFHYNFGGSNHAHYLPLVNHYEDLTTYQLDYLYPCYRNILSYFWHAVSYAAQFVSVKALLMTLDALWSVLTGWAVYSLSYRLFASVTASRMAVLMLVLTKPSPAGIYISLHGSIDPFSHTNFVLPFLLIAMRWALDGKWIRGWALVGLLVNIHVVSAAFFACMLCVMILMNRPRHWWRAFIGPLLFLLMAAPLIFRVMTAIGPDQITSPEQIDRLRFIYSYIIPYHRFPSTWASAVWVPALLWFGLGALGWAGLRRTPEHRMMAAAFVVLLAILGWLYIVVEVWNFSVAMMAFPFGRSGRFALLIALLYVARWVAEMLDSEELNDRFAGLCVATWGISSYINLTAGAMLPLLGLIPDIKKTPNGRTYFAVFMFLTTLILIWSGPISRENTYNTAAGMFVLAGTFLFSKGRLWPNSPRMITIGLILMAIITPLALRVQSVSTYLRHNSSMSTSEAVKAAWNLPNPYWIEMQKWVDVNLPKDAILLTPFHIGGFRVYGKRAVVCESRDVGMITVSYLPALLEWDKRVKRMTGVLGDTEVDRQKIINMFRLHIYSRLPESALVAIAKEYGADYIVTEAFSRNFSLPVLHKNRRFRLYRISRH